MPDPLAPRQVINPLNVQAVTETFLTERWVITEQAKSGQGVLDRATGQVTFPTAATVYDGPGALHPLTQRYSGTATDPVVADEHELRIEPGNRDLIDVGMTAHCPDVDGRSVAEWTITRIPEAAKGMTTKMVVRRSTSMPTTGGA